MQKRYSISSTPLLYLSAPYQALTLLVIGPPLDKLLVGSTVMEFEYTPTVTAFIILSCCIAVLVNFSTFLVIGKCDAVTYQVRCSHPARLDSAPRVSHTENAVKMKIDETLQVGSGEHPATDSRGRPTQPVFAC